MRIYVVGLDFMGSEMMTGRTAEMFAKIFGHEPRWIAAAPGRVNLIGEHTDYNEGFVLPMAIDRYTLIAGDRNNRREVSVHSVTTGESATFSVRGEVKPGSPPWSNYVRGVVSGFQQLGKNLSGFDAVIDSTVPFGGGVSSSAALAVASATFLEAMTGRTLDRVQKALICQKAEHDFAGVPCGIMDPFAAVFAQQDHALLLDCRSHQATPVALTDPEVTVLIINTNVRRTLADGAYAKRRAQCEEAARILEVRALRDATLESLLAGQSKLDPVVFCRARHVITENARTLAAAQAMQAADWQAMGALMYSSHESLRDDYEVSCPELDAVVRIASGLGAQEGVIGCRMTGGGFGGCAVCLVKTEAAPRITRAIAAAYEKETEIHPHIFSSRPGGGTVLLKPAKSR